MAAKGEFIEGYPVPPSAAIFETYTADVKRIVKPYTRHVAREALKFYRENVKNREEKEGLGAEIAAFFALLLLFRKIDRDYDIKMANRNMAEATARRAGKMVERSITKARGEIPDIAASIIGREPLPLGPRGQRIEVETIYVDDIKAEIGLVTQEAFRRIDLVNESFVTQLESATLRAAMNNDEKLLVAAIRYQLSLAERRANLVSLDNARKMNNHAVAAFMRKFGIEFFEWIYTYRAKTYREYHVVMDRKIYSIKDLPVIEPKTGQTGLPGDLYNCRCVMLPLFAVK